MYQHKHIQGLTETSRLSEKEMEREQWGERKRNRSDRKREREVDGKCTGKEVIATL